MKDFEAELVKYQYLDGTVTRADLRAHGLWFRQAVRSSITSFRRALPAAVNCSPAMLASEDLIEVMQLWREIPEAIAGEKEMCAGEPDLQADFDDLYVRWAEVNDRLELLLVERGQGGGQP